MSGAVDVFALTVRQLAGRRRLWLVLALVSLPVLAGVLFTLADSTATPAEFADDITRALVVSTILPLVMLLLGTAALGNEVADRTLVYLVTKPLPRWRIAVPKLVAAVAVGGVPVAVSAALAVALIQQGDAGGAAATGAGVLAGAAAYGAIFTWAGLATRHALVLGLGYVFVWEAALAAYLDGIRFLSVRRFTLALVHGLDEARLARIDASPGAAAAAVAVAVVLVGFTALAVRKLRRMDVP
jgi:ABC-2 type transport system permease protein